MVPWACERGTLPKFYWMGVNVTSLVSRTFNSSVVTLTPGPEDHGTNLTCQVTFPGAGVSTERTIQLTVCECPARTSGPRGLWVWGEQGWVEDTWGLFSWAWLG